MTSDHRRECFVYITPPGETRFVTAGRFQLSTNRAGAPIGRFVYGSRYLERQNAVPIDPLELKLGTTTYETTTLNGVFGTLRDASPDYWGRRVIERHAGKPQLGEMDYMLASPDDRAGALGFGLGREPPAPRRMFNRTIELERLQHYADAIVANERKPETADGEQIEELLLIGTSMGGARPKTVVEDEHGLWVAKFNRPDDRFDYARVERAMLRLAHACGIQVPESKVTTVGDRNVLLVKRFDREQTEDGYRRARMLSALTLLRAEEFRDERHRWSYVQLAEELRRLSAHPRKDAPELFRRMCFNALISNTDDHPRNHAVIAMDKDWKLSPAYDLTPTMPVSITRRDLALECGDLGRYAHAENLLSQCARFLLKPDEAKHTIDTIEAIVKAGWYETARREGVSEADCERVSGAFAYAGFRAGVPAD